MLCRVCGAKLLENARFCTQCGSSDSQTEPQSKSVRRAPSSSPKAAVKPMPSAPLPTREEVEKAVAAGEYSYDPESHLYYKSELATSASGKTTTHVVYYDTMTLKISQAEYLEGTATLPELQYENLSLDDISDTTTSIEEAIEPADNRVRWRRFFIPAVLIFLIAAAAIILMISGWYKIIPGLTPQESHPVDWQTLPELSAPVTDLPPAEASGADIQSEETGGEGVAHRHVLWPEFGHLSGVYADAKEDEKYIYYRPAGASRLYRINQETTVAECILDVSEFGYESIEAFGIFEDYLYYTVPMGERTGFFRVNRGGGQAEFIFTDHGGELIEAAEGFFFRNSAGKMMLFNPYNEIFPVEQPKLQIPEGEGVCCFAITPEYVYYSVSDSTNEIFLRQNRNDASIEVLLDASAGEIISPVIIGENIYFIDLQEEYLLCRSPTGSKRIETLRQLGAGIKSPFLAVTREHIVFSQSDGFYYAPTQYPERAKFMLTTAESPTAVTSEWVLWPNQAYHISSGRMLDISRYTTTSAFDFALSFEQAAEITANSSEVRVTLLEKPLDEG